MPDLLGRHIETRSPLARGPVIKRILMLCLATALATGCTAPAKPSGSATPAPTQSATEAPATSYGKTVSASAFVDSIGLNTHFNYGGTAYVDSEPAVVAAIIGLHVKHVREGMLYPFGTQFTSLQHAVHTLSAAGVRTIAGVQATDLMAPEFKTRWATWFDSVGGLAWVEATEPPNECDLNQCLENAVTYQKTLYDTVKGYAPSSSVSVYGPSFANGSSYSVTGDLSRYMDAGNVHLYTLSQPPETTGNCRVSDACAGGATTGSNIGNTPSLETQLSVARAVSDAKPIVDTEAGLCTTVDSAGGTRYNNVPRDVQAAYWPRYLLHGFGDLGIPRMYIYEIADDGISAPDFDQCGLIDAKAQPKPSYRILKTMLDAVDRSGTVAATPLAYTVSAPKNVDGNDVSAMAVASGDGSYTVFVWNPVSLFYQQSGNGGNPSYPLVVAPIAGSLSFAKTFGSATLTTFYLTTGDATTTTVDASKAIPLLITPGITMVRIHP